jgi:uncharacterized protein YbaA (DUF1428 family)
MAYISGGVIPVKTAEKEKFVKATLQLADIFRELGATEVVDAWGVDVPDGKVTDFKRAVKAEPDETVVFSWMKWPDKATADAAMAKMQTDPRMASIDMPANMQRMIFGGFQPLY